MGKNHVQEINNDRCSGEPRFMVRGTLGLSVFIQAASRPKCITKQPCDWSETRTLMHSIPLSVMAQKIGSSCD